MTKWVNWKCSWCKRKMGLTDGHSLIVGGAYIRQPRINVLCRCGKINVFKNSQTTEKLLYPLTAGEIGALVKNKTDVNHLFFNPKKN